MLRPLAPFNFRPVKRAPPRRSLSARIEARIEALCEELALSVTARRVSIRPTPPSLTQPLRVIGRNDPIL